MVYHRGLPLRIAQGGTEYLCRFLTDIWGNYKTWAAGRRSLQDLRELNDCQLADVGLSRTDQQQGRPNHPARHPD